jgi:hypothetical protein
MIKLEDFVGHTVNGMAYPEVDNYHPARAVFGRVTGVAGDSLQVTFADDDFEGTGLVRPLGFELGQDSLDENPLLGEILLEDLGGGFELALDFWA